VVEGLDFEDSGRRQIVEEDSTFDFGLDDGAVDIIRQVGVRREHTRATFLTSLLQIGVGGVVVEELWNMAEHWMVARRVTAGKAEAADRWLARPGFARAGQPRAAVPLS
jgi:hypothetical protein